jgi:hypothetical protein
MDRDKIRDAILQFAIALRPDLSTQRAAGSGFEGQSENPQVEGIRQAAETLADCLAEEIQRAAADNLLPV